MRHRLGTLTPMRWFRKQSDGGRGRAPVSPLERHDGESDREFVERLAHAHLDPELAIRWLGLLQPAVRLVPPSAGERPVARFGGLPSAPSGFTWPEWEGHGPLTFVAEVDLAAVAARGLDAGIPLPEHGRLLAFYYDGSYQDDVDGVVGTWDPETLAGARLLHVEAGPGECVPQPAPDGVTVLREKHLAGRQSVTFPTWEHPVVEQTFERKGAGHDRWMAHPVNNDDFLEALDTFRDQDDPGHQLGGWADHIQGPVEDEVAQAALGGEQVDLRSPEHAAEARRWTLLLQIGSEDEDDAEDEAVWGDLGTLYWMIRRERLPRLDEVSFTWQCG